MLSIFLCGYSATIFTFPPNLPFPKGGFVVFCASESDSLGVWRLGRLVCGRLLFATQIFVFDGRLWLKRTFRHIAHPSRQSSIATTSLRSALGCCRRSSPAAVRWLSFRGLSILSTAHPQTQPARPSIWEFWEDWEIWEGFFPTLPKLSILPLPKHNRLDHHLGILGRLGTLGGGSLKTPKTLNSPKTPKAPSQKTIGPASIDAEPDCSKLMRNYFVTIFTARP